MLLLGQHLKHVINTTERRDHMKHTVVPSLGFCCYQTWEKYVDNKSPCAEVCRRVWTEEEENVSAAQTCLCFRRDVFTFYDDFKWSVLLTIYTLKICFKFEMLSGSVCGCRSEVKHGIAWGVLFWGSDIENTLDDLLFHRFGKTQTSLLSEHFLFSEFIG